MIGAELLAPTALAALGAAALALSARLLEAALAEGDGSGGLRARLASATVPLSLAWLGALAAPFTSRAEWRLELWTSLVLALGLAVLIGHLRLSGSGLRLRTLVLLRGRHEHHGLPLDRLRPQARLLGLAAAFAGAAALAAAGRADALELAAAAVALSWVLPPGRWEPLGLCAAVASVAAGGELSANLFALPIGPGEWVLMGAAAAVVLVFPRRREPE